MDQRCGVRTYRTLFQDGNEGKTDSGRSVSPLRGVRSVTASPLSCAHPGTPCAGFRLGRVPKSRDSGEATSVLRYRGWSREVPQGPRRVDLQVVHVEWGRGSGPWTYGGVVLHCPHVREKLPGRPTPDYPGRRVPRGPASPERHPYSRPGRTVDGSRVRVEWACGSRELVWSHASHLGPGTREERSSSDPPLVSARTPGTVR